MKNIISRYCLILFVVTMFVSCNKSLKADVSVEAAIITDSIAQSNITLTDTVHKEDMLIQVFPSVFSQADTLKKAEYRIYNNTKSIIKFGSQFSIEKLIGDNWQEVELNELLVFEDILFALEPGTYLEIPLSISAVLKGNAAESGNYRIVKDVWRSNRETTNTTLRGEFIVEM